MTQYIILGLNFPGKLKIDNYPILKRNEKDDFFPEKSLIDWKSGEQMKRTLIWEKILTSKFHRFNLQLFTYKMTNKIAFISMTLSYISGSHQTIMKKTLDSSVT